MSDGAWFAAGGVLAAAWFPFAGLALRSLAETKVLADELDAAASNADARPTALPAVSVVVTARDEERDVEATVRRFLAQRGVALELVVVDDRSRDRTGAILDALAAEHAADARLVVVHNRELPPGRLGKCHACALGAARARGRWLLFADGDVTLAKDDVLARTVLFAERSRLDHVAVLPDMGPQSTTQEALTGAFGVIYLLGVRAYQMDKDYARGGGGVGAFNLMRRASYERIGGHGLLMMDTADDWKLGRLLKESGARQRIYFGRGLVFCPWQRGTWNVVKGLEKNAFGGCDYRVSAVALSTAGLLALVVGPAALCVAAVLSGAWAREPRVAAAAFTPLFLQTFFTFVNWALFRDRTGARLSAALLFPLGVLLFLVALWNSTWKTLRRGGVSWRGTFYPLADLKRGLVRPGALKR
jgi:hypothetical protein